MLCVLFSFHFFSYVERMSLYANHFGLESDALIDIENFQLKNASRNEKKEVTLLVAQTFFSSSSEHNPNETTPQKFTTHTLVTHEEEKNHMGEFPCQKPN